MHSRRLKAQRVPGESLASGQGFLEGISLQEGKDGSGQVNAEAGGLP